MGAGEGATLKKKKVFDEPDFSEKKKKKKSKPAAQALQPLAELQIPQIFTKPFILLMAYLITSFISFILGEEKKKKERTCTSNREYFC